MPRVIGYIDGFNLYYGMKARSWQKFYWIDPFLLVSELISPGHDLKSVKYFSARVKSPDDKRNRQTAFLDAIRASSPIEVILGKFYQNRQRCRNCKSSWLSFEEKMTDTAIGCHLVADAFLDNYDTAFLIGGDTDIVPAVKLVRRHFPKKQLFVWFPPSRKNQHVADSCHDEGAITADHLSASMMPDTVHVSESVSVSRPKTWR